MVRCRYSLVSKKEFTSLAKETSDDVGGKWTDDTGQKAPSRDAETPRERCIHRRSVCVGLCTSAGENGGGGGMNVSPPKTTILVPFVLLMLPKGPNCAGRADVSHDECAETSTATGTTGPPVFALTTRVTRPQRPQRPRGAKEIKRWLDGDCPYYHVPPKFTFGCESSEVDCGEWTGAAETSVFYICTCLYLSGGRG